MPSVLLGNGANRVEIKAALLKLLEIAPRQDHDRSAVSTTNRTPCSGTEKTVHRASHTGKKFFAKDLGKTI